MRTYDCKIVLEDGSEYLGYRFGSVEDRVCEIVFNTSMVGYQEIVSDPSYTDQAVVMTYPLIGNYGITDEDYETKTPTIGGLIVREYNDIPSNFRYTKTLSEMMEEYHVPGISGIDTRKLTRSIRDLGSRRMLITSLDMPREQALETIRNTPVPHDAVPRVSCRKRWYSRTANARFNVVAVDCGIKLGIVHFGGRSGTHEAGRYFSFQRAGGSGGCDAGYFADSGAAREISDFRHMSRSSDDKPCLWGENL